MIRHCAVGVHYSLLLLLMNHCLLSNFQELEEWFWCHFPFYIQKWKAICQLNLGCSFVWKTRESGYFLNKSGLFRNIIQYAGIWGISSYRFLNYQNSNINGFLAYIYGACRHNINYFNSLKVVCAFFMLSVSWVGHMFDVIFCVPYMSLRSHLCTVLFRLSLFFLVIFYATTSSISY